MLSLIGVSVFLGSFGGILWVTARRWRYLAKSYAGTSSAPIEKRYMQSAVLIGLGGFNSLKGIVTIGAHETGVSLRLLAPFSLFHTPLFIPYSDIRGWGTTWYLNARSTELEFRQAPKVKLVMSADQAEWIKSHAGHKMTLRETSPPTGNAGRGWYAFVLINAGVSLGLMAWLSVYLLSGHQL